MACIHKCLCDDSEVQESRFSVCPVSVGKRNRDTDHEKNAIFRDFRLESIVAALLRLRLVRCPATPRGSPLKRRAAERFMRLFALALAASVAACPSAKADFQLNYNGLGYAVGGLTISYTYTGTDNVSHSGTRGLSAGEMNMTAVGQGVGGSNLSFKTFCIDLFHNMTSSYMVQQTSLSVNPGPNGSPAPPPLGGWLGGGMAYLYNKFLTDGVAGSNTRSAAYQVALWRLTLGSGASLSSSDSGVNTLANSLYTEALSNLGWTGQWLAKTKGDDGQGVLWPDGMHLTAAPAPGAIVLLSSGGLFLGVFGKFRRRGTRLAA